MRITGGSARGRKLASLSGTGNLIRPTGDMARQAIFNILGDMVPGSKVLDLFAGTGALGIESLSRGAEFAVFIDHSREAGKIIQQNLINCFPAPRAFLFLHQLPSEALQHVIYSKTPDGTRFNLIFLDPPYQKKLAVPTITKLVHTGLIAPGATIIVEEHHGVSLPDAISSLRITDRRRYGEAGIWFYTFFDEQEHNEKEQIP